MRSTRSAGFAIHADPGVAGDGATWGDVPLHDLLTNESRRFGRHTTIVVVTPSTEESWVAALAVLQARG